MVKRTGKLYTYVRCSKDGSELWRKKLNRNEYGSAFGVSDNEIILYRGIGNLVRMDSHTGEITERFLNPFFRTWSISYNKGFWWVTYDSFFNESREIIYKGHTLAKCDNSLHIIKEIPISGPTQGIYFSPNGAYIYVLIYKEQIIVVNTDTLAVENVLKDKSSLIPREFDYNERFWFLCDSSTAEACDMFLTKLLSPHRLKGHIIKWKKDESGVMHATTYDDKTLTTGKIVNRIYRFE